MRRTVLAVLLVTVAAAQDFGGGSRRPGAGDYVVETGGALLGGALVGAGATVALGVAGAAHNSGAQIGAFFGAATGAALGYPLGCGLGTTIAGGALHAKGNTGAAYGGAYAGIALGVLAGLVSGNWGVGLLTVGVLPPAGAVIGYNRGAPRSESGTPFGARLALPTVALCTGLGPKRQRYSALDCRLVTVRF